MISIIVPVCNVDKLLKRCIESIRQQFVSQWELLLIDDGSTDLSGEICDQYAVLDDRIRVFHQKNAGPSAARNAGIEAAAGEWILFVDSDDWIEKEYLARIEELGRDQMIDVIQFAYYDDDCCKRAGYQCDQLIAKDTLLADAVMSGGATGYVWNKAYRNRAIEHMCFNTDLKFSEDVVFNIQVIKRADRIYAAHYAGYHHCKNFDGLTHATKYIAAQIDRVRALRMLLGDAELAAHRNVLESLQVNVVEVAFNCIARSYESDVPLHSDSLKYYKESIWQNLWVYIRVSKETRKHKFLVFCTLHNPGILRIR